MSTADEILANIIQWGQEEESVRALVVVGSRAQAGPMDELADWDVAVFAQTREPYIQDNKWLSRIGKVWVCISDKYEEMGEAVPTRLVIFEGGFKVDFALYPTAMFSTIEWDRSYKVMLDKDSLATNPKIVADGVRHNPPTETEVVNVIREFWFEAYHVAKYLKRDELWLVKSRDWATKELLLKMIEWHAQANHRWAYDTKYMGKHLKVWADAGTWEALHRAFAHFDSADSWRGLLATMNLFRQLAVETSEVLGFTYPQDVDQKITGFIVRLQER